jgi:phenylpyruvate tautomerase PptA (4-oxalocrotonate tautomerase family)
MKFQLLLHEGVVDKAKQPKLARELRRIYAGRFGGSEDDVAVDVTEIPKGRFFTAGEPSRSSFIGGTVPKGTSNAERTRLMSDITAAWCELTGCTPNDVVVSMSDAPA